jgi:hypothetical protein
MTVLTIRYPLIMSSSTSSSSSIILNYSDIDNFTSDPSNSARDAMIVKSAELIPSSTYILNIFLQMKTNDILEFKRHECPNKVLGVTVFITGAVSGDKRKPLNNGGKPLNNGNTSSTPTSPISSNPIHVVELTYIHLYDHVYVGVIEAHDYFPIAEHLFGIFEATIPSMHKIRQAANDEIFLVYSIKSNTGTEVGTLKFKPA